jgi:lipoate-protein ligase A
MALDEAIARTPDTLPTFRAYYWNSPSVSIGYFQKAQEVLNALGLSETGGMCPPKADAPTLVRRPTGGTAVLHDDQPSFSIVLRTRAGVVEFYHLLGQVVIESLKTLGIDARLWLEKGVACAPMLHVQDEHARYFCTSNFSTHDVIFRGQKVAGYSARRYLSATLFQGYLHLPKPIKEGILLEGLIEGIEKVIGVRLKEGSLTESEILLTKELRQEKYLKKDWNYKR